MIVIGGNGGGTISDAGSVVEVEPVGAEVVVGTVVVVVVEVVAGTVVEVVAGTVVVVVGAEVVVVGPTEVVGAEVVVLGATGLAPAVEEAAPVPAALTAETRKS